MSLVLAVAWGTILAAPPIHTEEGIANELAGVRSTAMGGAHRGVGTSNDALYLNPGGMALVRRYAVEAQYGYSPFDGISNLNMSAVDSKSGPVAGGLGYTHQKSDADKGEVGINRFYVGAGYAVSPAVSVGVTTRYLRGAYTDLAGETHELDFYNADVGAMASISDALTLGVVYNNVLKSDYQHLTRPSVGFGIGIGGAGFVLAADVEMDRSEDSDNDLGYHLGGEYVASGAFPIRVGYAQLPFVGKDGERRRENVLAAGVAWASREGALDVGFRQSLERERNWALVGAFKFFL
jgi:hypothetical protein